MLRILLSAILCCGAFLTGCGPRYVDFFPYHDNGALKPQIAFLPVLDSSNALLPWNLAREITEGSYFAMMNSGELFLISSDEIENDLMQCGQIDFFGRDLSFAKNFCHADFVVVSELIQHEIVPNQGYTEYPSSQDLLTIKLRVRIIDVRKNEPTIALQEILTCNQLIPKKNIDYFLQGWGTPYFRRTPYGMAHQRLIQDFAKRIEDITTWNMP